MKLFHRPPLPSPVSSYYGLFLWFPELFQRMALYGGTPCNLGTANSTEVHPGRCQPVSSQVYFEGFLTAVSNLPGNIFTLLVIDRVGRKPLLGQCPSVLAAECDLC